MTSSDELNICIISASHRSGSQSLRIGQYINQYFLNSHASMIDLYQDQLPLWDGEAASDQADDSGASPAQRLARVKAIAGAADAFVFIIPEWHGMAPAGLKNFLLWCGAAELAHKPVLLVGVSAGSGGAFVVSEIRSSGYKNSRLLYLPEHLLLRDVSNLWMGQEGNRSDDYLAKRTRYALDQLQTYASVLKPVREQLCAGLQDYANGMS